MKILGARHVVELSPDGGVDDGDAEYAQKRADPKGDKADADMGRDDIDDPVRREGGDTEKDEKGDHIFLVGGYLVGPFIQDCFPPGEGEEGRAEGSRDEIT